MRKLFLTAAIALAVSAGSFAQQLLSYQLVRTITVTEMDSILTAAGNGANLVITPEYDFDVYKVAYLTPYRHPDSLVKATGAVFMPKNSECPLPLLGYGHGTMSRRGDAPSLNIGAGETFISMIYASQGVAVGMPDYLGLGESDSSILIHPYITFFHQGNTMVNMLRTVREMADSLNEDLNGQLFLTGYSQGGYTTMATHKIIEEQYSNEFTVTASAPMSGPYDLKIAQVEQVGSDSVYSTPGYLPYIILSYQSYYGDLYDSVQQILKAPYDSIMPAVFFGGQVGMGTINNLSTPVPKDMIQDSVIIAFESDSTHPLRMALADNDLLGWAPQAPVKLHYCNKDDQVSYLNSERAFDDWINNGATAIEKQDFGALDHNGCVSPAVINSGFYLQSFLYDCTTGILNAELNKELRIFPNPASDQVMIRVPEEVNVQDNTISIYDMAGQRVMQFNLHTSWAHIYLNDLTSGIYIVTLESEGTTYNSKLVVE